MLLILRNSPTGVLQVLGILLVSKIHPIRIQSLKPEKKGLESKGSGLKDLEISTSDSTPVYLKPRFLSDRRYRSWLDRKDRATNLHLAAAQ